MDIETGPELVLRDVQENCNSWVKCRQFAVFPTNINNTDGSMLKISDYESQTRSE